LTEGLCTFFIERKFLPVESEGRAGLVLGLVAFHDIAEECLGG
jgi:hypothetical protein